MTRERGRYSDASDQIVALAQVGGLQRRMRLWKSAEGASQLTAQEAWSRRISNSFTQTGSLRKLAIPLVLLLLAIALGYGAYALFPSRSDNKLPAPFLITIRSRASLYSVSLELSRIGNGRTAIDISMYEDCPRKSAPVYIEVDSDVPFSCHRPGLCIYGLPVMGGFGRPVYYYHAELTEGRFDDYGKAWNDLRITANSAGFGFTSNGASALVMIPSIHYEAPGKTVVTTQYDVATAANYDWTGFPAAVVSWNASWSEQLSHGNLAEDREIEGSNRAVQRQDDFKIFLSGAFVGIGGGAFVGAIQEGMHIWTDDDRRLSRKRRSKQQ